MLCINISFLYLHKSKIFNNLCIYIYILLPKNFLRKDISLMRNCLILFCLQKSTVPPIYGQFYICVLSII